MSREIPPGFVLQPDGSYSKPRTARQINSPQIGHYDKIDNPRTAPVLESNPGHAPLGPGKIQKTGRKRFLVRVTSFRKRLIDTDNLCEKFVVDLCRYSGMLPDDCPAQAKIEVDQIKIKKGEAEKIEITIEEIL